MTDCDKHNQSDPECDDCWEQYELPKPKRKR
jgi:hypothetical protein